MQFSENKYSFSQILLSALVNPTPTKFLFYGLNLQSTEKLYRSYLICHEPYAKKNLTNFIETKKRREKIPPPLQMNLRLIYQRHTFFDYPPNVLNRFLK